MKALEALDCQEHALVRGFKSREPRLHFWARELMPRVELLGGQVVIAPNCTVPRMIIHVGQNAFQSLLQQNPD